MFFKKRNNINENDFNNVIESCLTGNEVAQRLLYKQYYGYGRSIAFRYASNEIESEEILNDGFLKVFRNLHQFDLGQPFKAWFGAIIVNTAIDYYRRKQKYAIITFPEQLPDRAFDENILDKFGVEEIMEMVRKLTPAYRTVFMMSVVDGFNHREIAEKLGINEGTSKSNLAKARYKLQQMLMEAQPEVFAAYANAK